MSATLTLRRAGPGVSVQDGGRPGYLAFGLSRGGAIDRLAMAEGAALLGQSPSLAALEIAGGFVEFTVAQPTRIALTGAPHRATLDGAALVWNAAHLVPAGGVVSVAGPGGYAYVHAGGGVAVAARLGARGAHIAAGLGAYLEAGAVVPLGDDPGSRAGVTMPDTARFDGGTIRVLPGPQTAQFDAETRARFCATDFTKDARANRMGARMVPPGAGFSASGGLSILSEIVTPGDIQITGDGTPFVLLVECQTTGGYPRIGTVIPDDLARVAQAPAGSALRFAFVTHAEALEIERKAAAHRAQLRSIVRPLVRDPATIPDLLSYQLISGVTAGDDLERPPT